MKLRNYDNVVTARQLCQIASKSLSGEKHTSFEDGHLTAKSVSGTVLKIHNSYSNSYENYQAGVFYDSQSGATGLVCGSGNTPVNYDDYKLDAQFGSSKVTYITSSLGDVIYDESTNTFSRTFTKTFMANSDITIREIGFISSVPAINSNNSKGSYSVLTYRKVLEEPVEVVANSNFQLQFTTTVSACSNKPADYDVSVVTELEFIESSGAQWINSGIIPTKNTRVEADVQLTSSANDKSFFGIYAGFNYHITYYTNKWYCGIAGGEYSGATVNYSDRLNIVFNDENGNVIINGTTYLENIRGNKTVNSPMLIFARNGSSTGISAGNVSSMRLYSFKIYESDQLVRDFIPVKLNTVVCLYDRVSQTYFYNENTGEFSAGPKKIRVKEDC